MKLKLESFNGVPTDENATSNELKLVSFNEGFQQPQVQQPQVINNAPQVLQVPTSTGVDFQAQVNALETQRQAKAKEVASYMSGTPEWNKATQELQDIYSQLNNIKATNYYNKNQANIEQMGSQYDVVKKQLELEEQKKQLSPQMNGMGVSSAKAYEQTQNINKQINQLPKVTVGDVDMAKEYAQRELNAQNTQKMIDNAYGYANQGGLKGVNATLGSVGTNLISGAGGAYALGNAIANNRRSAEDYVPIDTNNNAFKMTNLTNALRQGVSDSIANKVKDKTILGYSGTATGDQPLGVWAYNIGTEILDNTARFLVAKGIGKIASANGVTDVAKLRKLSGKVANALMSSQVASSTMISNLEKGYSQEDALMLAYISAGIEGLTEEISVETLLNNPNHWVGRAVDKRIKNPTTNKLAKAFVSEGLEEVESNFGNRVAYTLINAKNNGIDENNLRQVYAELLKDSSSKEEAFAKLLLQLAKEDASSFLAGAISGLGMGASEAISTNRYYANIGKQERAKASGNSTAQPFVEFAKKSEDNTYLSKLANKPTEKLSNAQLGYLMEEGGKEVYKNKVKEQARAEGITDEKLINALALKEVGNEISKKDQRRIDEYNKSKETESNESKPTESTNKNSKVVEENTKEAQKSATETIVEKAQEVFKADVKDLKSKYASSMAKTIIDAVNSNNNNKFSVYTKDFEELAKTDKRFLPKGIGMQIGNRIFFNSKASEEEIAPNVLGHEIGEQLKYTKVYKDEIVPMAVDYYGGKESIKGVIEAKKKLHSSRTGQAINDEVAMYELTNDFLGDMMLHSNKFIDMLKGKDTAVKGIAKIIKSIKAKTNGKVDSIEKLENAFEKALQERKTIDIEDADLNFDKKSESINPSYSLATWEQSDYIYNIDEVAKEMSSVIGCSVKKAKDYIASVNSIAKIIANDKTRLDYEASPDRSSFVSNVEYGGSFDFSTICKKRRLFTGTFEAIQKELKNTPLTSDEMLKIRDMMKKKGYEVSCGLCYVEGSRTNMGEIAKQFIERYKRDNPKYLPTIADVTTPNGQEYLRLQHPEAYETLVRFLNNKGKLKTGDSALFSSQAKPKMYQLATEYNGEVLKHFSKDKSVEEKNKNGGLRIQSFSDFEIIHLIDMMQVIMDMSRAGLGGQAYTKVPNFAWALGDTGLKINLSMIAKGVDGNGKIIFDEVEGMKWKDAEALRNKYSDNVGTILVVFNNEQLKSAMMDDRIDYIIPFHRSQWNKNQFEKMGLPEGTKDYQPYQNEKWVKPKFKLNKNGELIKDKIGNYGNFMPNKYWDFKKSGRENAQKYLDMCAKEGRVPKFARIPSDKKSGGMDLLVKNVDKNGNVSYSLPNEKWADGYWKLLIDFKMYNNEGKGVPQQAVVPNFNMEEATRMLNEYKGLKEYDNADNKNVGYEGEYEKFPVAQDIVDEFLKNKNSNVEKYKKDFLKPSYSDTVVDSEGNELSKGQQEFFKDSKARNKNGNLSRMFHGTWDFGFTIFDSNYSDDKTALFFTDNLDTAKTYSLSKDEARAVSKDNNYIQNANSSSLEAMAEEVARTHLDGIKKARVVYDNDKAYVYVDYYNERKSFPSHGKYEAYNESYFRQLHNPFKRGVYSVYLNLVKPLVIDAKGNYWNKLNKIEDSKYEGLSTTRDFVKYAKDNGYDGVIFNNIIDNSSVSKSPSNVMVAFDSNQVKSTDNLNPTSNPDIRYSDAEIGDTELSSNTAYYNAKVETSEAKLRDQAIDNAYASVKSLIEDLKQQVSEGTVQSQDYKSIEDAYKEVIKLEKQKAKDDQKLKDMDKAERKEYQDFWKKELDKADAKLDKEVAKLKAKEIVDKYQEQIKNARERRKRSQESQQLLRALKQLKAMRKKASPDFQAQIDDIIGDINLFGTNVLKNGYTRNDGVVVRGELDLQNLLKELELKEQDVNFINDKSYKEYKSWVERFNKKQIGDMSLEEIEKLLESATTLRHQILTYNQTVGETQDRLMSFIAHNVANEVESSKARRIGNATNFSIDTLRPKTFFKQLGGFSNGSLEGMYQELENGQTKFIDFTMKATKPFDDFVERNPEVKKWGGRDADLIEVQLGDKKVKINKMMRISLYMHLQNDDNMKHIVNGGIRVPDMKLYNEGNIKEAYARGIVVKPTKEVLIDLVSNMSPKELEFADLMKKHFKNASVEINNTSMALDGYEKATVDNYYPIHSDPTFLTTNFESIVRDFRLENTGSLKAREGGANPIILEDANNVLTRQIDTIGKYVGYAVPLRNFNTLYNFHIGGGDTVKGIINKKSTQYGKYIEHLIAQINGNNGKTSDFSKFSGNYASAVLNFNISVALSQTASYPTAMAVLGEKALRKGLTMGKVDTEIMSKYTPLYWYRTKGYIDNSLSAVKNASSWIQKLPGTKWIQAMDLLTTRTLWNASQVWVQDNTDLKQGTDAYWQKVAEMYNRTIYDTQPNYTVMQRPEVLRSDSELVRQLFMFKTQSYQNYNMLYESLGEMIAKKGTAQEGQARKQAFVTASTLLIANAVFTAFKNLVKMARNKKEEDWFDEDGDLRILKWLMDNYFSNALGSIPLGSEVFEAVNFNNASYDTFTIPAVEVINSMISAYQVFESDIVKAISSGSPIVYFRQNRAKMMKDIWSLSKKISQFAGIPLDNVAKYIGGMVSWFMPEVTKAINNTINPVKKNDIAFSYEFDLLMKNELGFTNDKLYNLYQKAGDMVLPSFDVSNSSYGLTITQQYDVKEDYKKNVKSIFNTMFNMQGFKSLNSDQQAHCVVNAYSYAKEMALSKVNKDYPKTKWIKEAKSSPSSYIINKNKTYKK